MVDVTRLYLIVETDEQGHPTERDIGTGNDNANLELSFRTQDERFTAKVTERGDNVDHYEPGRSDIFEFDISNRQFSLEDLQNTEFELSLVGTEDDWLPSKILLLGYAEDDRSHILTENLDWPRENLFSTTQTGVSASYLIGSEEPT